MTKIKFFLLLGLTFTIAQYLNRTAYDVALYALVTGPGTFLHELAHYTLALVLNGSPENFNLIPSGNTLGSVTFHPNWYNAASVGLAPFLLAPLTFLFTALAARTFNVIKAIWYCYLSACSWVACTPSSPDMQIAMSTPTSFPFALVIITAIGFSMYFITRSLIR